MRTRRISLPPANLLVVDECHHAPARSWREAVRLGAAEAILSRGWGRPIQAFQVDGRFLTKKLSDMTPEEIKALEERLETIEMEEPDLLTFSGQSEDTP